MPVKTLFAAMLALGLGSGLASAQTADAQTATPKTAGHRATHDPILGTKVRHAPKARTSAQAEAEADKQPPGTENGNQPDRAAAGGGGR